MLPIYLAKKINLCQYKIYTEFLYFQTLQNAFFLHQQKKKNNNTVLSVFTATEVIITLSEKKNLVLRCVQNPLMFTVTQNKQLYNVLFVHFYTIFTT